MSLQFEKGSEIELFIFNIGKIFNSKTDSQFNFHKFKGNSWYVICWGVVQFWRPGNLYGWSTPLLCACFYEGNKFLEACAWFGVSATPKSTNNVIYAYDLARGAVEGYLKTPVVMGRSNMAGYSAEDIEEMKIRDGLMLHEHRKGVIRQFCDDNALPYVNPSFWLLAATQTMLKKSELWLIVITSWKANIRGK